MICMARPLGAPDPVPAGIPASTAANAAEAITRIATADPHARILICGSLYLAGRVLRDNG